MFMGNVIVKIPLITWRDGRPRFSPGPRLRRAPFSFAGEDLRHPDGNWFSLNEAIAWSEARQALIKSAEEAASPRAARRIARKGTAHTTLEQLFEWWFAEARMNGKTETEGKKTRKPLATNTVNDYKQGARVIEHFDDGKIWQAPAAAITSSVLGNEERGVFHKIEVARGLSTARKTRATLSSLYSWAQRKGHVPHNPVKGAATLPTPQARIRYGLIEEIKHLVLAAITIGRPEVALSILLGVWTGQRQNDRLALADGAIGDDGIMFRQLKKNGQPLLIPPAPDLAAAIRATKHRRRDWKINYHELVLDERTRRPFSASWYKHTFARVRAFAVTGTGEHEITGETVTIAPMPSLVDFHDQDLRDTAVTWLALAECSLPQIASITGHSLKTIQDILKHYLGMHPELARTAIGKMVSWYDKQGEGK